jgi:tRNA pseudouridine55 synthase
LRPPDAGLVEWPVLTLAGEAEVRFGHGNPVEGVDAPPGLVRVYGSGGLLGLGEVTADKLLKAKRLMNIAR